MTDFRAGIMTFPPTFQISELWSMREYWFLHSINFPYKHHNILFKFSWNLDFLDHLREKNCFHDCDCLSVAIVVCKHDHFRKHYRIGLPFGKLLEGPIERWNSLTRHFWPTVLVLSIKNVFLQIKNSIFPPNYMRYEQILRNEILYFEEIYKKSYKTKLLI